MQEMIPSWSPDVAAGDMKKALQMPSAPKVWFDFLLNIFEMQSGCPKFSKTGPATKCFGLGDREWACEYNGQSRWRRSSFKVCNCWTKTYVFVHVCCIYRHRPCSTLLVPSKVKVVWGEELPLRVKTVLSHTVPIVSTPVQNELSHRSQSDHAAILSAAPHGRFRAWSSVLRRYGPYGSLSVTSFVPLGHSGRCHLARLPEREMWSDIWQHLQCFIVTVIG